MHFSTGLEVAPGGLVQPDNVDKNRATATPGDNPALPWFCRTTASKQSRKPGEDDRVVECTSLTQINCVNSRLCWLRGGCAWLIGRSAAFATSSLACDTLQASFVPPRTYATAGGWQTLTCDGFDRFNLSLPCDA